MKVGDWLEIGAEHGVVKNIRVRSTEIETLRQGELIVPTASSSPSVEELGAFEQNRAVVIPVPAALDCDPKKVEGLLMEAANAHRDVQSEPRRGFSSRRSAPRRWNSN